MIYSYSFAKSNIDSRIIDAQARVMAHFPEVRHTIIVQDNWEHWQFCDFVAGKLGSEHEAVMLLDVDCLPVHPNAFKWFEGKAFAGNVQRSNHIQNNAHLYVAPSCMYLSRRAYSGASFKPTHRGDVGEELTYTALVKPDFLVPTRFLKPPLDGKAQWDLNAALKPFGRFTFFADLCTGEELFMHAFQMRMGEDIALFLDIAEWACHFLRQSKALS